MAKARVKLSDLEQAFEFASFNGMEYEYLAFVDKETGRCYTYTDFDAGLDEELELPDDLLTNDRYVQLPDQQDLDLGKQLALDFADRFLGDDAELVYGYFSRRGAYGKFKQLLAQKNLLENWHQFENKAQLAALKRWCNDNALEVTE